MALVFSAVGAVTQMSAGSLENGSVSPQTVQISSSPLLKSAEKLSVAESSSMKNAVEDELVSFEVDPTSPSSNLYTAMRLLLQAFRSLPLFSYISFLLSFVFLVLYLNPFNMLGSSEPSKQMTSHAKRRQ